MRSQEYFYYICIYYNGPTDQTHITVLQGVGSAIASERNYPKVVLMILTKVLSC